jgi:hypothetical protein
MGDIQLLFSEEGDRVDGLGEGGRNVEPGFA